MEPLRIAADALWIVALAIMSTASQQALRRVKEGASARLCGLRLPPAAAFFALPVLGLLAGVWLSYAARMPALAGEWKLIMFAVRATAAALFALLHLRTLSGMLGLLAREGQLRP